MTTKALRIGLIYFSFLTLAIFGAVRAETKLSPQDELRVREILESLAKSKTEFQLDPKSVRWPGPADEQGRRTAYKFEFNSFRIATVTSGDFGLLPKTVFVERKLNGRHVDLEVFDVTVNSTSDGINIYLSWSKESGFIRMKKTYVQLGAITLTDVIDPVNKISVVQKYKWSIFGGAYGGGSFVLGDFCRKAVLIMGKD